MVTKACDPVKPTLEKSLAKNREKLDDAYQDFYHDFRLYKMDYNDDDNFNSMDEEGKAKNEYNDEWMEKVEEDYYDLVDKSDGKLESLVPSTVAEQKVEEVQEAKEVKACQELKMKNLVENQIKLERQAIHDSISNISTTVSGYASNSIGVSQGQALRSTLSNISTRIDEKLQRL